MLMQNEKLSSWQTILYQKWIPAYMGVSTILGFIGTISGAFSGGDGSLPPWFIKWIILAAGGLVTTWSAFFGFEIQDVELEDGKIKVFGLRGIDKIELREIESITETRFQRPKVVILHLRRKSRFGKTVKFIPRGSAVFLGEHPVVSQLKEKLDTIS